jgi:hypothetical protein
MPIVEYLFILTLALLVLTLLNYIRDLTHRIALRDRVITQLDTKQREQDALLEAHHEQLDSYRTTVQSLLQQLRDRQTVLSRQAASIAQFNDALINVETLREFVEVTQEIKRENEALRERLGIPIDRADTPFQRSPTSSILETEEDAQEAILFRRPIIEEPTE